MAADFSKEQTGMLVGNGPCFEQRKPTNSVVPEHTKASKV